VAIVTIQGEIGVTGKSEKKPAQNASSYPFFGLEARHLKFEVNETRFTEESMFDDGSI
jgi:hypothetical protein